MPGAIAHEQVAKLLLKADRERGSAHEPDQFGRTPLHAAAEGGSEQARYAAGWDGEVGGSGSGSGGQPEVCFTRSIC